MAALTRLAVVAAENQPQCVAEAIWPAASPAHLNVLEIDVVGEIALQRSADRGVAKGPFPDS